MARGGKGGNRGKKWHGSKGGPPRGGDGQGLFAGGSSTKYRTQPLVSVYLPQLPGTFRKLTRSPRCTLPPALP